VSDVFHGRDIFAPICAHLANGVPLDALGSPIDDPVRLAMPRPSPTPDGLRGEVEVVDHFGNLRTNIRREDCGGRTPAVVRLGRVEMDGLVRTFGDRPAGTLVALWGSGDELCVAVVGGSAAATLEVAAGAVVEIRWR
jgi:hypothetical protein